jgi:hypothetical protein
MELSRDTLKFEKLRGQDNYAQWKYDMENFLIIADLWEYVEEAPVPSINVTGDESQ